MGRIVVMLCQCLYNQPVAGINASGRPMAVGKTSTTTTRVALRFALFVLLSVACPFGV